MNDWIAHGIDFGAAVELAAVILLAALGLIWRPQSHWETRLIDPFLRLARRPVLATLACGAAPLLLRAILWPDLRFPIPGVLDEYSYLLAADTFAHGRLTNPTHQLWMYFESFNIIQQPTYASKYPPLQGLVMAFGQVFLGHPWWGVYLSTGILGGALYWALAGWVPRRWAMLGSFLALLQWELLSYWMNSYWGGSLAAIGGALLLGSFPRLQRSLRRKSAGIVLLMALGLAILANTRPYEGMMFSIPLLIAAAWRVLRRGTRLSARILLPAVLLLAVTAGWMALYNWRVTGKPWRMPYAEHERQYNIAPVFIFLPLRPAPAYRHPIMAAWWQQDPSLHARQDGMFRYLLNHAYMLLIFYVGPALLVAYAALWLRRSEGTIRWLVALLLFQILAILLVAYPLPHYASAATSLILLLAVYGLRSLRRWRPDKEWGVWLVRVVVLSCLIRFCACPVTPYALRALDLDPSNAGFRCCTGRNDFGRDAVQQQLEGMPGRHLVVVKYGHDQTGFREYVYNLADIDSQKVVWARSMSTYEDQWLLDYYKDRQIWLLTVEAGGYNLARYPGAKSPGGP
jgi:hypothetical protein